VLQGQPRDYNEYVIYDKRRALIEYVVFYSAPSWHSSANGFHSGSSSPVSGGSSPTSGRSTPHSDAGADEVVPVTYESVKRVNAVRQRSKPLPTQSGRRDSLCVYSPAKAGFCGPSYVRQQFQRRRRIGGLHILQCGVHVWLGQRSQISSINSYCIEQTHMMTTANRSATVDLATLKSLEFHILIDVNVYPVYFLVMLLTFIFCF